MVGRGESEKEGVEEKENERERDTTGEIKRDIYRCREKDKKIK